MISDDLVTLDDKRLSQIDPRIFKFLDAWRAARKDETVPFKADFDPMLIPGLLQFVWLYRFDPSKGDFICRLAGEQVNAAWGHNIRDKSLKQIVGSNDHSTIFKRWQRIVKTPLIHVGTAQERLTELTTQKAERMLTPMKDTSGEITYVLGISLYRYVNFEPIHIPPLTEDIVRIACADI